MDFQTVGVEQKSPIFPGRARKKIMSYNVRGCYLQEHKERWAFFKFASYLVSGIIHSTRWQKPNRSSSLQTTSSSTSQSLHSWHAQEWPVTGLMPEGSGTMTRKTFLSGLMKKTTLVWSPCRLEGIWLLYLKDFVLAWIRCGKLFITFACIITDPRDQACAIEKSSGVENMLASRLDFILKKRSKRKV